MFNMSKKAFWVPYNEGDIYPTVVKAHQAISKYCDENGDSYTFTGDDEVVINGKLYEIYRVMNLEAVVITELSAEKVNLSGPCCISHYGIYQRSPRNGQDHSLQLILYCSANIQMICRAGCPHPPRENLADCVKLCEFVQILFTICPRIAGRNCVKFIRITKNDLSALYSVDKCVPKVYCNSNSSAKCNDQEMTYPYHRLQKAVGCARRQQGAVWPSPASSLGESGQNRSPCSSSREPSVNGVRSPAQCGVGLRVSGRH